MTPALLARGSAVAAAAVLVGACTGAPGRAASTSPPSPAASPSPAATSTTPASADCPATADLTGSGGFPERQGVGDGVSLWALLFPTGPAMTAGREIKIAWRMTGSGALTMTATGPGGRTVQPVWGPEAHESSTWSRPGDEWGTGWVFPTAGCWTVRATRSTGSAHVTFRAA